MRSRIAGVGAIVAVTTAVVGLSAVTLAVATPRTAPIASPQVASLVNAQGQKLPVAADYCYVEAMIPHHAQALELSGIVLAADGVGERTLALAEFIVTDQRTEITAMEAWRSAWMTSTAGAGSAGSASAHGAHGVAAEASPPAVEVTGCGDHGSHEAMKGMATADQIDELRSLQGSAAQDRFLELMIAHHLGALEMAETAVHDGTNAFVRSSAKHVLVEQAKEIAAMTALLAAQ